MEVRIRLVWIWAAVAAVALFFGWRTVARARQNLVTLNVRNMDVRKVVGKVEWQTWERILVAQDVQGKVTLNVRRAPLELVLDLIAGQVAARPSHLYPVYQNKAALKDFQALLRGESTAFAQAKRWTNFSLSGGMGPGGGFRGGFASAEASTNQFINLSFRDRDTSLASVTLGAASHAQVVPEDGVDLSLNLEVKNATRDQAVAQFAHALHRTWDDFYALRGMRPDLGRDLQEADAEARKERMAARMDALSPEQRARMEEMRNLSPEERQARMQARMADPAAQQRMIDRTLNNIRSSTPEQIVQRKRQRAQMAQSMSGQNGQNFRPTSPN
jgi:hypothetical protein